MMSGKGPHRNIFLSSLLFVLLLFFLLPKSVLGQVTDGYTRFGPQELDQMLAPVALYPDSLLAQMLMASTYPLEVVEAERWSQANKNLKGERRNVSLEQQTWDLSVKALVPFSPILALMSGKLDWTQRLGDALLAQESEVMDTIQRLRSKAYAQGNLKSSKELEVLVEQQVIRVEPRDPQMIYVPIYNPAVVYGAWWYPNDLPYAFSFSGVPTPADFVTFAAGIAVGAAWNSGWGFWNWGGHHINANVNRNININQSDLKVDSIQTAKWQHSVEHRKGDPYRIREIRDRYNLAQTGNPASRRSFRGYDLGRGDGLTLQVAERGFDPENGSSETGGQPPALWKKQDRSENPRLQAAEGSDSTTAFQGLGRTDDVQPFSERGQASRRRAGSLKADGGRLRGSTGVVPGTAGKARGDCGERFFGSPEEAVQALAAALRDGNAGGLVAILGPGGKPLFFSGNEVADQKARESFIRAYDTMHQLERKDETRAVLHVGSEDWPFPVPIVKWGKCWSFSSKEGRDEISNRKIGKNELNAIQVCLAMVDAQREYAAETRQGDGVLQYAQQFVSDPGRRNGLYWPVAEGEDLSPLGPAAARAGAESDSKKRPGEKPAPYHGYFYRILKAQGKRAPGGARDYLVRGKMIGGFGIVAYPAVYGDSGVMTFVVNQDGVVLEKDLGPRSAQLAQRMRSFDPDETWRTTE